MKITKNINISKSAIIGYYHLPEQNDLTVYFGKTYIQISYLSIEKQEIEEAIKKLDGVI